MAEPWSIPRLWDRETVVVIGGGESFTLAQLHRVARARLEGRCRVMAVSDAGLVAWWADWLHACDFKWWDWHRLTATKFPGYKTTLTESVPDAWGVRLLHCSDPIGEAALTEVPSAAIRERLVGNQRFRGGFDPDPGNCRSGSNGVYQAMHCGIHAGAGRFLLLGVDMNRDGWWFGEHPDGPSRCDRPKEMAPWFDTLKPALDARGIETLNCSPGSALDAFPRATLEDVL